ncbi:GDSL-type esterase/lipase family protein [Spirosoma rigui]|uniref:GDSL-type esterase/lipase family protein n=1 Tax=Spirosoma rigui TaxID=564064 RepID=UPI0012D33A63|nr:GDSL-type esterase/lipase family protein [Spirosoma rigui]
MLWYEDDIHQLETKLNSLVETASGVSSESSTSERLRSGWPRAGRPRAGGAQTGGSPTETLQAGPVVFYGSSSIRLWTTLATDFPNVDSLNLGFGGSTLAACAWFFERVILPASPKSVVFYAGDNDLGDGRHPEEVCLFFSVLAQKMQTYLPGVPLTFMSIKVSPARWDIAPKIRQTNELIAREISRLPGFQVIDVTTPLLDAAGRPRLEFFENDGLHLSPAGYRVWQQVLEQHPSVF